MRNLRCISILFAILFFVQGRIVFAGNDGEKLKFRGKIFSDFVGIGETQPNGLIQTNFYFSYEFADTTPHLSFFRNIVLIDVTFSKIENNKRELPIRYFTDSTGTSGYVNRLDLYQYAFLIVSTKLNLFTLKSKDNFFIYFDAVGAFYSTNVSDSLNLSETKVLHTIAPGINVKLNTNLDKKSGLSADFSYTRLWPTLFSNSHNEIGGAQISEGPAIQEAYLGEERKPIDIIDAIISHKKNDSNKFLRFAIVGNYFSSQKNASPNLFYQLQLGVEFSLSKIFADKEEKQ